MMRYLCLIFAGLLFSGCTLGQPRNINIDFAKGCEDTDCVIDRVDRIANDLSYGGERFVFMEGYPDSSLRRMKDKGLLTIDTMNPLTFIGFQAMGSTMFGYAELTPGKYGEVYSCHVKYIPMFNYTYLVHELTHCQGYADSGLFGWPYDYTKWQKELIDQDGVTRWVDTEYYRLTTSAR
jgi:hypothetical protein